MQSYKVNKITKKQTSNGNDIKPPSNKEYQNKSVNDYERLISEHGNFDSYLNTTKIKCKSLDTKEIYISAEGLVTPCCWTAGKLFKAYESIGQNQIWSYLNNDLENINALLSHFNGILSYENGKYVLSVETQETAPSASLNSSQENIN